MTGKDSFTALMGRLHAGEDAAAREVFRRFAARLFALARRHIETSLAHRLDAEDVVQSAFKSFFVRHRQGKFELGNWDGLWGLLTLITVRKCADRIEYYRAARRDVRREVSSPDGHRQPWELALGREPMPQEAAMLAETIENLFHAADEDERPVLKLSLQGCSAGEVSLQLGRPLRTVHRLRERLRKRLERLQRDG